jgi:hypothetical protein
MYFSCGTDMSHKNPMFGRQWYLEKFPSKAIHVLMTKIWVLAFMGGG